jgi:glycyl-tRNA synthetase beta chain
MTDKQYKHLNQEDLLIELGCEELPPKALDSIREAFFKAIKAGLEKQNFAFKADGSRSFSTPRRIAVLISRVASSQEDQDLERRGPAVAAAFDAHGKPTGAAIGFARSVGQEVSDLETLSTDKGEWLFARQHVPGMPLAEMIFPMLEQALKQLPVPKPMRWSNYDFSFVRPVHWLVVMHGEEVYPGTLLGQAAVNTTRGHRIHAPGPHRISDVADYERVLREAYVVADHESRCELIREKLLSCNENVHIDPDLLNEVNNLVEWPVAIQCTFDEEFLDVPHEALVASMQDHQKFFPVMESSESEQISNHFIAVANLESTQPALVREGFERVIRPRLADARFFLQQDLKKPLEAFLDGLDHVIFQNKLGTIGDKSRRISRLSKTIAEKISADPKLSKRAAILSKCDLMTQMVGEFPELQGVMGRHYALACGEHPGVAIAIGEHYAPRFAGDGIPGSDIGRVVGIADRLDTLVSIFAAGLRPSGNKDPFALRRAALGVVRILLEAGTDLPLDDLLAMAASELSSQLPVDAELLEDIRGFIIERARNHYREQGFSTELINAVIASDWDTLPDLNLRLKALDHFMGQEAATSLAAANKRIGNILRKTENGVSNHIDEKLLVLEDEKSLFEEVVSLEDQLQPLLYNAEYAASLELLAGLRSTVDTFFDSVMVMDEDVGLRKNRLALLTRLKALFDRIADLSVLG